MFLDQIAHGVEDREGEEVKIITVRLRVQPFEADLARALPGLVRATLFKLNHPEPQPHLKRVDFTLGVPRQRLEVYAAPDTSKPAIVFDQVLIAATYARTEKNVDGFAFIWKGSFGPVGRRDLEFLHDWLLGQRFVTTTEAEPGLFPDDTIATVPALAEAPLLEEVES
jgi:hypothetical protein